jgi:predicted FMN-binding regulatory protein PaiB
MFSGHMYAPPHFAESDPNVLRDAVRSIRAGELITVGSDGLEASFIPLLISDDAGTVTGHLAKGKGRAGCIHLPELLPVQAGAREGRADLELHHGPGEGDPDPPRG